MTDGWEPADTLFGALQRGLGRGALRAVQDGGASPAVLRCLARDQRWDTQVDDRAGYLARLVRDLRMPIPPLLDLLGAASDIDTFHNVLGVLETLGAAGDTGAIDGLRGHVIAAGPRWADVLAAIADAWPRAHWDDLLPVVRDRAGGAADEIWWDALPWTAWADADETIAARITARSTDRGLAQHADPAADQPVGRLLAMVRTGDPRARWAALSALNRRGPQPDLLPMLATVAAESPGPGALHAAVSRAIRLLGDRALGAAREWTAGPDHPLWWRGVDVLAAHGVTADVPVLLGAWSRMVAEDLVCGFDDLAGGLARIGGPAARQVVPRLHDLWLTPHSHERAAYLRALLTLDPGGVEPLLIEGLWDCEPAVRRIAVGHTPLTAVTRPRLSSLTTDPLEDGDVRAAAVRRLG